jgi:GGDEF domain-containing protein
MNVWQDRRTDHVTRKRVAEMSTAEMRRALLVHDKTDLPNKRAFEEGEATPFIAMCDVNGLKTLNDQFGYTAGDVLIKRFAETLISVGLDAYHDKGDEFLCKGKSFSGA